MENRIGASSGVTTASPPLSDPSLTSFSRQGVVDNSSGFLADAISGSIDTAAQTGLDIDEGFAKATLENNISEFVQQSRPDQVIKQKQGLFDEANESLLNLQQSQVQSAERGDNTSQTLAKTAPEFKSIMAKLQEGASQGLLTRDEVEIRAREATRKAIARRPGLARELTQHAEQVLNLSGVRDIDSFEEDLAKAEAQRAADSQKRILDRATSLKLPFDRLSPDIPDLNERIQRIDRENEALGIAERLGNLDAIDIAKNKDAILKTAPLARQGLLNDFQEKAGSLFSQGMSQSDISKAFLDLRTLGDTFINRGDNIFASAQLSAAEAKPHRDAMRRQVDNFITELKKHEGAENIADIAANVSRNLRSLEEANVRGELNVTKLNLIGSLSNTIMGNVIFKSNEVQEKIGGALSQLISSELTKNNVNYLLSDQDAIVPGVPNMITGIKAVMQGSARQDTDTAQQASAKLQDNDLENAITHAADILINNPHGVSSETRFNTLKHLVTQFSGPEVAGLLNDASSGVKGQLGDLYDQQRIILTNQRDREIQKGRDQGAQISMNTTDSGQIIFNVTHNVPVIQRQISNRLNNGVGNRTNELVQAFSTLFGEDLPTTLRILKENNNNFVERDQLVGGEVQSTVGSENFMDRLVQVESGGNPDAESSTSNAVGLTQFIPSTWNRIVDKFAPELRDGKTPEQVLELRKDPKLSKQLAARLAEDNAEILRNSGVESTDSNLYLAHFLGVGGATNVLTESDATPLEEIIGARAIKANSSIMKGKTVGDLKQWAKTKMGE